MSYITVTQPSNYVPAHGIPIKVQATQGNKKRNRQRKVSGSSSGASSTDELAPKSVRMDRGDFHAAIAKAQAQPVVKNAQFLTTEDLKYRYYGQKKVRKAASTVPIDSPPTLLTASFSTVVKAAATPPLLDFKSLSPSPSSRSASSNSTVDFPALAASSAPEANKAPVTVMTIKPTSTPTKTTNDNSSSWNTVARHTTKPTKSMHVPVSQNVWAPKSVPITSPGTQATNNVFPGLSDPVVSIPEKKQVTRIDTPLSGPEVTKPATGKSPKVKHTWVEVSSKKQNKKTDKRSPIPDVPANPLNNKFEALFSEPKSKAHNAPASKKRGQTTIPVEKPAALRSVSGISSDGSSGSSPSKKKTHTERKKGKKTRSKKTQASQDSAIPATETKSTAYRLSSDSLPAITVLSLPGKTLTGSKQDAKPVSESKSVVSSSSEPPEFKDSNITSPTLLSTAGPKVVESEDTKAAEILSTPPVKNDIAVVTEFNNEVDALSASTDPEEDATQIPEPTPLKQEAYLHSTLESRMLLCHGSDEFDDDLEVVQTKESYNYRTMESRFGLQHVFDETYEEVEVVSRTEEPYDSTTMESRFDLQHGSDEFEEETEIVVRTEESYDYTMMESRTLLQHGSDDFDEHDLDENVEKAKQHNEQCDETVPPYTSRIEDAPNTKATDDTSSEEESTQQHLPHNPTTLFLGTISLSTFTSQLTAHSRSRSRTPTFTLSQITTLFTSFSAFERMYHSIPQLPGTPTAQDILGSTTLQQQIKLGRTKLGDFLERIRFVDGVAGLASVLVAFEVAADEEREAGLRMERRERVVGKWL